MFLFQQQELENMPSEEEQSIISKNLSMDSKFILHNNAFKNHESFYSFRIDKK